MRAHVGCAWGAEVWGRAGRVRGIGDGASSDDGDVLVRRAVVRRGRQLRDELRQTRIVQPQEVEEVSLDEWGIRRAREEHLAQEGGQRAGEQHQLELRQLLEHGKVDFERIRGPWERGREYQLGSKLEGMDLRSGREPAGRRSFRIHVAGLPRVCEPLESPSEHPRNALTSTTEPHRQGTPGTP